MSGKDNGVATMTDEKIDELGKAGLEMDDPSCFLLDGDSRVDNLAPLALTHMRTLDQCRINIAANQEVNKQEVERLTNLQTVCLVALTKIRREFPAAIELAKKIAKDESAEARRQQKERDKLRAERERMS